MRAIISGLVVLIVITSCYYDSEEYLYPQINNNCDTTNVTFSGSIKPILANNCLSCHSNSTYTNSGGNIKLEDYPDVKARVNDGHLWGAIAHLSGYSPMPKNAGKLSDCKITIFKIWINAGAPDN